MNSEMNGKSLPSIILDTDMGNDIDDALALAMLHSLQTRHECRLIGVTVSKDHPDAPRFVDIINTYYGRGDIPIGLVNDGPTPEGGKYAPPVVEAKDEQGKLIHATTTAPRQAYPQAVPLLRRLLASQPDQSVTMVMIGFSTNMARLLDSKADALSDLSGRALFERKVRSVVMMAGQFTPDVLGPQGSKPEYNVMTDIPSARAFIETCPVPITFTGLEIGLAVPFPARSIEHDFAWATHHPIVEGYRLYKPMPYDRPTWDLTAVLQACRADQGYFGLSEPGKVSVLNNGAVRFQPDEKGPHRYLTIDAEQAARVFEAQVALVTQPDVHAANRPPVKATITHIRRDGRSPAGSRMILNEV